MKIVGLYQLLKLILFFTVAGAITLTGIGGEQPSIAISGIPWSPPVRTSKNYNFQSPLIHLKIEKQGPENAVKPFYYYDQPLSPSRGFLRPISMPRPTSRRPMPPSRRPRPPSRRPRPPSKRPRPPSRRPRPPSRRPRPPSRRPRPPSRRPRPPSRRPRPPSRRPRPPSRRPRPPSRRPRPPSRRPRPPSRRPRPPSRRPRPPTRRPRGHLQANPKQPHIISSLMRH